MVNAILLSSDTRMVAQIKEWFRELVGDVRLETFSSLREFSASDDEASARTPAAAKRGQDGPLEPVARKPLRLLIVDLDLLEQDPIRWCLDIRKTLQLKAYEDPVQPIRIMALAFDEARFSAENLRHPAINDLVLKPLERSLFLQKIEFLVADKADVKPSFLFRQPVHREIEIGKDAMMDEISEYKISIRNPAALKPGMFVSIYSSIFGEGREARVHGRVSANVKHPTYEGFFLVRLVYFGITSQQLARVRHYIRDEDLDPRQRTEPKKGRPQKDEGLILKRVAVIDMNRDTVDVVKTSLRSHYLGVDVRMFPSYTRFMGEMIKNAQVQRQASAHAVPIAAIIPASEEEAALLQIAAESGLQGVLATEMQVPAPIRPPPAAAGGPMIRPSAFPLDKHIKVILNAETHEFVRFEPQISPNLKVLGHTVATWLANPSLWQTSIDPEDRDDYREFLVFVGHGALGHATFRMQDKEGHSVFLEAHGVLEKPREADGIAFLKIDVKELEPASWRVPTVALLQDDDEAFKFDLIMIDGSFVGHDVNAWLAGLEVVFDKAGIQLPKGARPPVVVMGDERSSIDARAFRQPGIAGFLYKSLDRRLVVETAAETIAGIFALHETEPLVLLPCKIPIRLATDAIMNEISEFGLSVLQKAPIRAQTFMRFFSPILGLNANGVIACCAYSLAVGEGDELVYQAHFRFFGVSDELFKRVRTWILENYVQGKQGT